MNVPIPERLADALNERARRRQVPVEDLVQEAVTWYLRLDESLLDELQGWQDLRDEALDLVDRDVP